MKLSKTAWWILGVSIFILAAVILVVLHAGKSGDAEQLEDNISITKTLLNELTAKSEALDSQIAQLYNQLNEADSAYRQSKANFPKSVMSIEYDEELFFIADDFNLEVMSLVASEPYEDEVEGVLFYTTIFEVEVRGLVSNIISFINNVTTGGYFDSATIELVNIEVPEPDQDEQPTAVIQIIVYHYEGE